MLVHIDKIVLSSALSLSLARSMVKSNFYNNFSFYNSLDSKYLHVFEFMAFCNNLCTYTDMVLCVYGFLHTNSSCVLYTAEENIWKT